MKVVERAQKKNTRVAVTSSRRPASGKEYERLHKEVNKDLYEKILVMKAETVWKYEVGSSFLDMDDELESEDILKNQQYWKKNRMVFAEKCGEDNLFVVSKIIERKRKENEKVYFAFLNIEKAYDRVAIEGY
ncbi:hypothetical protein FHG87_007359 [Trinorchestia longiramus]|nr:hypothetical protein FHG87_007359 [Trinorchestia longiramus]